MDTEILEKRFGKGCLELNPLLGLQVHCRVCDVDEEIHWGKKTNEQIKDRQLCFNCNFWHNRVEGDNGKTNVVIVNGTHFMIEKDEPARDRRWSGHGGSRFIIKFNDGREAVTHNLWCQGKIGHHWRDKLPDNAIFIFNKP